MKNGHRRYDKDKAVFNRLHAQQESGRETFNWDNYGFIMEQYERVDSSPILKP